MNLLGARSRQLLILVFSLVCAWTWCVYADDPPTGARATRLTPTEGDVETNMRILESDYTIKEKLRAYELLFCHWEKPGLTSRMANVFIREETPEIPYLLIFDVVDYELRECLPRLHYWASTLYARRDSVLTPFGEGVWRHRIPPGHLWALFAMACSAFGDRTFTDLLVKEMLAYMPLEGLGEVRSCWGMVGTMGDKAVFTLLRACLRSESAWWRKKGAAEMFDICNEDGWRSRYVEWPGITSKMPTELPTPGPDYWLRWLDENEAYLERIGLPYDGECRAGRTQFQTWWWRVNEEAKRRHMPVVNPYAPSDVRQSK